MGGELGVRVVKAPGLGPGGVYKCTAPQRGPCTRGGPGGLPPGLGHSAWN